MEEQFLNLINPEVLILIPTLIMFKKNLNLLQKREIIPKIFISIYTLSVLLCLLFNFSSIFKCTWQSFIATVFTGIVQGIFIASLSINTKKLKKMLFKIKKGDIKT